MVAQLQWFGDPLKLLFADDGRLAMDPSCCCIERACDDCPPGTVPPYLKLTWLLYGTDEALPALMDCHEGNVFEVLLEYNPDVTESEHFTSPDIDEPICCFDYIFTGVTSKGMAGWRAEMWDWGADGTAGLLVYPLESNDSGGYRAWRGGSPDPQSWLWAEMGEVLDCNEWTLGFFTGTPGNPTVFLYTSTSLSDPNCHFGNNHTFSLEPFYP
jgi:hypothetical protein